MSFCPNCGAQLPDGSKFCGKCGSPVAPAPGRQPQPAPGPEPEAFNTREYSWNSPPQNTGDPFYNPYNQQYDNTYKPGRKKGGKLLIILLAVIAALVVLILLLLFKAGPFADDPGSGQRAENPYEQPVADLFDSMSSKDPEKFLNILPEELTDTLDTFYGSREGSLDALTEYAFGALEEYGDLEITYEITDVYHLNETEIQDLENEYIYNLALSLDIDDAYALGVDATLHSHLGSEEDSAEITEIQCAGKWYIDAVSMLEF